MPADDDTATSRWRWRLQEMMIVDFNMHRQQLQQLSEAVRAACSPTLFNQLMIKHNNNTKRIQLL